MNNSTIEKGERLNRITDAEDNLTGSRQGVERFIALLIAVRALTVFRCDNRRISI